MGMNMKIIRLEETDSTNNFLRSKGGRYEADLLVAVARYQTAGRGQGTNKWESEPGKNLLFSILAHPQGIMAVRQFVLSMAEALAIKDVLDEYMDDVTLKWPNDVYWCDRKISGTLIETVLSGGEIKDCIFGTGINVNQWEFRGDAPNPVSLCSILGHEVPLDELLDSVLRAFLHRYNMVLQGENSRICTDYLAALYRRTGTFAYEDAQGRFLAEVVTVEDNGRLVLRDEQGRERRYAFKEVKHII